MGAEDFGKLWNDNKFYLNNYILTKELTTSICFHGVNIASQKLLLCVPQSTFALSSHADEYFSSHNFLLSLLSPAAYL